VTNSFVVVPVRVSQFAGVSSFQFSMHWNTNVASFVGLEQFGLNGMTGGSDSFGTTLTSTGTLTVLWIDPDGAATTIPDNTMIFAVRFRLVGPAAASTGVTLDDKPTAIVAGDENGAAQPVATINGILNIDRTLIVTCSPNKTVECGSAWNFDLPTPTDSCGGLQVSINILSTVTNTSPCGFTVTRTWEILDPCLNRTVCSQTVTAVDTTPPVVTCAPNKTAECGSIWNFDSPLAFDHCSGTAVTVNILSTVTNAPSTCGYTATRSWEILDPCGNRSTCTQTITVVDTTPPIVACAANKTVECGSAWNFDAPNAFDNCVGLNVIIRVVTTVTNTTGACGATATRTWEILDACTNRVTCTQIVTVVDTTKPVVNCATDKTVECGSSWIFDVPTATDNCVGTNLTIRVFTTITNASSTCGYTVARVWEILDPCANRSTCQQIVTVVDTTPPVVNCAPNKTVECGTAWNFDSPTATDNCVGTNLTIRVFSTVTNAPGTCGYTATRTWEILDNCTNRSTCVQIVTVIDTTPPVATCAPNKTVEFGQGWNFDAPTGTDSCVGPNVTIRIINTVTNTSGFCGPTFSATRTWEIADGCSNKVNCTQTVTVRDTTAPVFTCAPDKTVNCLGPWAFDAPTAVDLVTGTTPTITVLNTVTNGSCGSGFTATRTWRATDSCGNSATCSQIVSGRAIVSIGGTVFNPTNYPATMSDKRVAAATVMGPTNMMGLTAPDGTFSCVFEAASNVVITPMAPVGGNPSDGVTTLDISLVRRHILSVSNLDSPYKLLAADVDGSSTITTLDLSLIRRLLLGITNRFPSGPWRFVPANYVFPNNLNPWSAPTNRIYAGVASDLSGQDFVAIKMGDVNNSWIAPAGDVGAKSARAKDGSLGVGFRVNGATNIPGGSVVVPVTVSDFRNVTSVQGTLAWDPAIIHFVGTESYGLSGLGSGNFGTTLTSTGKLVFSWDDPSAEGFTAPDGAGIFAVRFEIVGTFGSVSPVALLDSVLQREVGVNFAAVTFESVDGEVRVMNSAPLQLTQVSMAYGTFSVAIPTTIGNRYTFEYTDTLPGTNWTAMPPVIGDGKVIILSDPAPSPDKRFYRIRID
jgi:hypothetical protein